MDAGTILTMAMSGMILGSIMLIIGRLLDPVFRVKLSRIQGNDIHRLSLVSRDKNTIVDYFMNIKSGIIEIQGKTWIADKKKIYKEDDPTQSFFVKEEYVKWKQGIPTLFLNADSMTPIDFVENKEVTTPEEVGGLFAAWYHNQVAKMVAGMRDPIMIMLIICIIASVASVGAGLMSLGTSQAALTNTQDIKNYFGINATNVNVTGPAYKTGE